MADFYYFNRRLRIAETDFVAGGGVVWDSVNWRHRYFSGDSVPLPGK